MNPLMGKFIDLGMKASACMGSDEKWIEATVLLQGGITLSVQGNISSFLHVDVQRYPDGDDQIQKIIAAIDEVMGDEMLLRTKHPFSKEDQQFIAEISNVVSDISETFSEATKVSKALDELGKTVCEYWYWDKSSPEQELRRIMNDVRDPKYPYYLHSELSGGRKVEDYVDARLTQRYQYAQELHETFEDVFGLDPSNVDFARVEKAKGIELFIAYMIAGCNYSENHSKANALDLEYLRYRICQVESIATSEPTSEHGLELSPEFKKWDEFYVNHFERMSQKRTTQLLEAYALEEDLSPYEPKTDWRRYKPKPKTSAKDSK